jgi:hypothetical protein
MCCCVCSSLFVSNVPYTRCDQKVARQYFVLSDNSILFLVHAVPFKVVPLLFESESPLIAPPLEAFPNTLFSEQWNCSLHLFFNNADALKSPAFQCELDFQKTNVTGWQTWGIEVVQDDSYTNTGQAFQHIKSRVQRTIVMGEKPISSAPM